MTQDSNTKVRIEVEISISSQLGLETVAANMEETLQDMIHTNHNSIITQIQIAFDENGAIILYHEGVMHIQNPSDLEKFSEDLRLFCANIARMYPELEIIGQLAIEKNSPENNAYFYLKSEAGSYTCFSKELSEDTEPGIVFDEPVNSPHSLADKWGLKTDIE